MDTKRALGLVLLTMALGCSHHHEMALPVVEVDYPPAERQAFSYPVDVELLPEYTEFVARNDIKIYFETMAMGEALTANMGSLLDRLFDGHRDVGSGSVDRRSVITLKPSVRVDRTQTQVVFGDVATTVGLTWEIRDLDGEPVSVVAVDGVGHGAPGYSMKPDPFLAALAEAFNRSADGLSNDYFLVEADVVHRLAERGAIDRLSSDCRIASADIGSDQGTDELLVLACFAARKGNVPLIDDISGFEVDLNRPEPLSGLAPLHFAATSGQDAALDRLLALGCDLEGESAAGRTPLYYAGSSGQESTWKHLIDLDCRLAATDDSNNVDTAALYRSFGDYLKANGSGNAASAYDTAADYFRRSAVEFDGYAKQVKAKIFGRFMLATLGTALSAARAHNQASYHAKSMAEISPSGRGRALAVYQIADASTPDLNALLVELKDFADQYRAASGECAALAEECR